MIINSQIILSTFVMFTFGLCIGSFLNVCIFRIPEKKSIVFPASFCPNCKTSIPFYCNIPILSYLVLKGRCKFCQTPISFRYPLVELLTGLFFGFLFLKFNFTPQLIFWLVFTCFLIIISFIDIDHQIIPDIISLPGILIFSSSFFFVPRMDFVSVILGILAGGGSLYAVAFIYFMIKKQEGMGGGDIKLLAMIGAATGVKGVFFTIFCASVFGSIAGSLLLIGSKKSKTKLRIPFGPFLSIGTLVYIFWGDILIGWYLSLLSP